jgi:site-specific recombinase XerD
LGILEEQLKELWVYPEAVKWLEPITKFNTKKAYADALVRFMEYTGLNPTQLIDEAENENKKELRQRQDIVKSRVVGFYNWMLKDAPKKDGSKGYTPKQAVAWSGAIRGFYRVFGFLTSMRGVSKLPKPKVVHPRRILNVAEIKRLVDFTMNLRDKAIILTMFQGALDVSTLCSLNYGHVASGLESGESPLKISNIYREKAGTSFYTFIGHNAIDAINIYLSDLRSKGIILSPSDPLFLKDKIEKKERIESNLVQKSLREITIRAGLVSKKAKANEQINPHALRESFGSIMGSHGLPDNMIDFLMGHSVGELAEVYQRYQADLVKGEYARREIFLSTNLNGNGLGKEVGELKDDILQVRRENEGLKTELKNAYEYFSDLLKEDREYYEKWHKEMEKAVRRIEELEQAERTRNFEEAELENLEEELDKAKSEKEEEAVFRKHGYHPKNKKGKKKGKN